MREKPTEAKHMEAEKIYGAEKICGVEKICG